MITIDLFCGTKSFSKVASERGHMTHTIDCDDRFCPDECIDILAIKTLPHADILWASPPCTTFSVASIGTHWTGGKCQYIPKTKESVMGLKILEHTMKLIEETNPRYWFVENPRGVMRKMLCMQKYRRVTVTYCQYGDTRMKPTDIWTNCDIEFKPPCKNGSPCHVAAPRGSKTGTQGLKGSIDRSVVPKLLIESIFDYAEE